MTDLSDTFWDGLLASPLTWWAAAGMVGCFAGLTIMACGLLRMRRRVEVCRANDDEPEGARPCRPSWAAAFAADSRATATVEFALVFPILLFFILMLAQTMWLMGGNTYIHYAAFAAGRTAIVQIPTDYDDDAANVYTHADGATKHDRIRAAATLALVPVAGQLEQATSPVATSLFTDGLVEHFASYGREAPNWVGGFTEDRVRYAAEYTEFTVLVTEVETPSDVVYSEMRRGGMHEFGAREPITVRVDHRLNLPVPYVNRFIADGEHEGGLGQFTMVSARYTLTNEGAKDELPPAPEAPRMP